MPDDVLVTDRVGLDARDTDIAIVAIPPAGSLQGGAHCRIGILHRRLECRPWVGSVHGAAGNADTPPQR
jgi:hypothetical protein